MMPNRRSFLVLLAKACASGLAATGLFALMRGRHERRGPTPLSLPDYRSGLDPDVGFATADAADPRRAVEHVIGALGGITRFVRRGDRVLVKPNVGFDRPPSFGVTSSPEVVGAVVGLCRRAGASEVWVFDNPINNPRRCFAVSGVGAAVEEAGGSVLLPRPSDMVPLRIGGKAIDVWVGAGSPLARANRLIGIPTVKDHNLAGLSVTMKNWYGFLGAGRNTLHQRLHEVIVDLAAAFVPTLVVVDGTRSLVRHGPTGGRASDVVRTGKVAAGIDQVALDAWAAELMGRSPESIPSIGEASRRGLGTAQWRALRPGAA